MMSSAARSDFRGQGISLSGPGDLRVGRDVNIIVQGRSEQENRLLADLRSTDPRDDKSRIERTKGGLLYESYCWILDQDDFRQWRYDNHSRLLWVKGDPGKGKTMLLCGIINELEKLTADTRLLSYFFCQSTEPHLNNAKGVLCGLIYLLLLQRPSFIAGVQEKYDHAGRRLFEDTNSWDALSKILLNILAEPSSQGAFLIIDALDECATDLNQLLHLIVHISQSSHVKIIVSSRNWPNIEDALAAATEQIHLCLELNERPVAAAVSKYIEHKVDQLARAKKYNDKMRKDVQQYLASNANDTFLWVSLVFEELVDPKIRQWHTYDKLHSFPPGLDSLYMRMMSQIDDSQDFSLCWQVLRLILVACRPLSVAELPSLVESPEHFPNNLDSLEDIIRLCGSFLAVREGFIHFVHQSAKDFLLGRASSKVGPPGITQKHRIVVARSVQVMSRTLKRDMYNLRAPGFPIHLAKTPDHNPLALVHYSCVYWINHLLEGYSADQMREGLDVHDGGTIHTFLEQHFLHWLEALSLFQNIPDAILQMSKLLALTQSSPETSMLSKLVQDGLQFLRTHRTSIENNPLQIYTSALLFTPARSMIRRLFYSEEPIWVVTKPAIDPEWGACLQTLEGHRRDVNSVTYSEDGTRLASACDDNTVKVWDAVTGKCLWTFHHIGFVSSVAFSGDNVQLVSASYDTTIKVWDINTGHHLRTLKGHTSPVTSIAISGDSTLLASTSAETAKGDGTIKIWDFVNSQCRQTLVHGIFTSSIAFSSDSLRFASASYDRTIKVWDSITAQCLLTLVGHASTVSSVAFSADGMRLASASFDATIKVWNTTTGQCLQTLEGHSSVVSSVAFSNDSTQLASASADTTIRLWDASSGECLKTLQGHSNTVTCVAYSRHGTQLVSASYDTTIKIWDSAMRQSSQKVEGHSGAVDLLFFSADSTRVASTSSDLTIKVWDCATSECLQTFKGHSGTVVSLAFSGDSSQLASTSSDMTVRFWDCTTGHCFRTFDVDRLLFVSLSDAGFVFETGLDTTDLHQSSAAKLTARRLRVTAGRPSRSHNWGVDSDSAWITRDSENILWLPPEYRSKAQAVKGSMVAISCALGQVLVLRFTDDELDRS